jgi:ankyrin repeat protein
MTLHPHAPTLTVSNSMILSDKDKKKLDKQTKKKVTFISQSKRFISLIRKKKKKNFEREEVSDYLLVAAQYLEEARAMYVEFLLSKILIDR